MLYQYSNEEIKKNVQICLEELFKKDSFLIENEVNERSVSHKLAEYLQVQFPGWDVDCEYNKKMLHTKILDGIQQCSEQKTTDRIIPDIIIHKRKTDDNLLVVEIKYEKDDPCDIEKLKKFTSSSGEFKYKLGLFIKFNSTNGQLLKWFKDGQEVT